MRRAQVNPRVRAEDMVQSDEDRQQIILQHSSNHAVGILSTAPCTLG